MKFLISTSDNSFYLWQVLTQINNLRKFGYDADTIYVIASNDPSQQLQNIMNHPKVKAKFYVYPDTRHFPFYPSSVRLHVLEKFYVEHHEIESEPVFYIDPDVLFTRAIDFDSMLEDEYWHLSDSRGYIGAEVIKSKGFELLPLMCQTIGISENVVLANDEHSGGAQYLMKGVNAAFWKKCYTDSEILYERLKANIREMPMKKPIQAWCADMWAVLWNAWLLGYETRINPELAFSWTHYPAEEWEKYAIYHNAGITSEHSDDYFKKNKFNVKTPFRKAINISDKYCGWKHLQEIRETEINFSDIIW